MKPIGNSVTVVWENMEMEWSKRFKDKCVDSESNEQRNFILNDLKRQFPHLKELLLQEAMRRAARAEKPKCSLKAYTNALRMFLE